MSASSSTACCRFGCSCVSVSWADRRVVREAAAPHGPAEEQKYTSQTSEQWQLCQEQLQLARHGAANSWSDPHGNWRGKSGGKRRHHVGTGLRAPRLLLLGLVTLTNVSKHWLQDNTWSGSLLAVTQRVNVSMTTCGEQEVSRMMSVRTEVSVKCLTV